MYHVIAQNGRHSMTLMSFDTKSEALSYINGLDCNISNYGVYQKLYNGEWYDLGIQLDYEDFKPYMGI